MNSLRRSAAAVVALAFTLVTMSPAAAAPRIDFGPVPPPFIPTIDVSLPPVPVGELSCTNGVLVGNFTDADQDDNTLRVYAITANDVPVVRYPAVRAWGTFMAVVPGHRNLVNLVAVDEDGNRSYHHSVRMTHDGRCYEQ